MIVDVPSIPSSPTHRQRYPLLVGLMLGLVGVCLSACAQEEPVTRTASHDVQSWQPAHLPQPISRNPEFVKRLEQSPTSQQTSASSSASRSPEANQPEGPQPAAPAEPVAPVAPIAPAAPVMEHWAPQPPPQPAPQPAPAPARPAPPRPAPAPAPQEPAKKGPVLKLPGTNLPDFRLVVP